MSWTPPGSVPAPLPARAAAGKVRSFRGALAALLVGLALFVPAIVTIAPELYRTVTSPTISAPNAVQRHLTVGRYALFERTGSRNSAGPVTTSIDTGITIRPNDVTVTDPAGNVVNVEFPRGITETIQRNGAVYTSALVFAATKDGTYRIAVHPDHATDVVVGRTFGDIFRRAATALLAALAGALALLVSIVLLIVNARRPAAAPVLSPSTTTGTVPFAVPYTAPIGYTPTPTPAPAPAPAQVPPAAWYPDPERPGGQRYWDGARWTEHRA